MQRIGHLHNESPWILTISYIKAKYRKITKCSFLLSWPLKNATLDDKLLKEERTQENQDAGRFAHSQVGVLQMWRSLQKEIGSGEKWIKEFNIASASDGFI